MDAPLFLARNSSFMVTMAFFLWLSLSHNYLARPQEGGREKGVCAFVRGQEAVDPIEDWCGLIGYVHPPNKKTEELELAATAKGKLFPEKEGSTPAVSVMVVCLASELLAMSWRATPARSNPRRHRARGLRCGFICRCRGFCSF